MKVPFTKVELLREQKKISEDIVKISLNSNISYRDRYKRLKELNLRLDSLNRAEFYLSQVEPPLS